MSGSTLDLICVVDTETTGLNPTTHEVIELGCILFSLSHNCVLQQVSTLVPISGDVNPVEHINGISAGAANGGQVLSGLVQFIDGALHVADAAIAHNAPFDKAFIERYFGRHYQLPWIDTLAINWPRATRQGCNLTELALAYGVPVWQNHRALTDCQLLAHIIQREPMAAQLLTKELEPKVWATWASTRDDKEGQQRARLAGFRWSRPECPAKGVWSRLIHPDDIPALGLEVVVMRP